MNNEILEKIAEQIGTDDSILVDGSAMLTEGSPVFFQEFLSVLPKLKDKNLIIPIEGINAVNAALDSSDEAVKKLADEVVTLWLSKAVDYSRKPGSNLIIVGEPTGAFSDKTILNQVSFLLSDHNVLLITQDQRQTYEARELRDELELKERKLHCCKVMPEGRLGVYRFPNGEPNE